MTAISMPTRTCNKCGETKPISRFYGKRKACRKCVTAQVQAAQKRRRAEMGDEAYRAHQAAIKKRSLENPAVRKRHRLNQRILSEAHRRLVEAHRDEYEALLQLVRYEMDRP